MSIRKLFEEQLEELKIELLKMCRLAESMIDDSIKALTTIDRDLGKRIGEVDKKVDDFEMDIEKQCMRILLKQQPVAKDFREVSTALKIITDVERIGDQASDIGELVASFPSDKYFKELTMLKNMGSLAMEMVHKSIDSFLMDDENEANDVVQLDDKMDKWFYEIREELIDYLRKESSIADQAIYFMMIAKYLERIGDHAVNICEWTKYKESGVHIKY